MEGEKEGNAIGGNARARRQLFAPPLQTTPRRRSTKTPRIHEHPQQPNPRNRIAILIIDLGSVSNSKLTEQGSSSLR